MTHQLSNKITLYLLFCLGALTLGGTVFASNSEISEEEMEKPLQKFPSPFENLFKKSHVATKATKKKPKKTSKGKEALKEHFLDPSDPSGEEIGRENSVIKEDKSMTIGFSYYYEPVSYYISGRMHVRLTLTPKNKKKNQMFFQTKGWRMGEELAFREIETHKSEIPFRKKDFPLTLEVQVMSDYAPRQHLEMGCHAPRTFQLKKENFPGGFEAGENFGIKITESGPDAQMSLKVTRQ